jgi:hypothetical protein
MPIPESEVDVERVFNTRQDMLGLRRFSMGCNTLGMITMLKDELRVRKESKNM